MAEEEVATKAPESDLAEPLVPGDTPAQEGATMGVSSTNRLAFLYSNASYRNTV